MLVVIYQEQPKDNLYYDYHRQLVHASYRSTSYCSI